MKHFMSAIGMRLQTALCTIFALIVAHVFIYKINLLIGMNV